MPSLTLVTPTYANDYERFALQRESIERCGIDLPHFALVNHEDMPQFKKLPFQKNLTLVSSQELLPPRIEARRLGWGRRRRELRYWTGRPGIHGWMIQQLLKLASPKVVKTEGIVCLDSDTFFVRKVSAEDFCAENGKLHLYETTDDVDAEMGCWTALSMDFLGVKLTGHPLRRYTHSPVPFHRQVVLDMQAFIEARHNKPWMNAMLDARMIFEYSTYGAYSRFVDELKHQTPVVPSLCAYYWWPKQIETIETDFLERITDPKIKAVIINSNIGRPVEWYHNLVEGAWQQLP